MCIQPPSSLFVFTFISALTIALFGSIFSPKPLIRVGALRCRFAALVRKPLPCDMDTGNDLEHRRRSKDQARQYPTISAVQTTQDEYIVTPRRGPGFEAGTFLGKKMLPVIDGPEMVNALVARC